MSAMGLLLLHAALLSAAHAAHPLGLAGWLQQAGLLPPDATLPPAAAQVCLCACAELALRLWPGLA